MPGITHSDHILPVLSPFHCQDNIDLSYFTTISLSISPANYIACNTVFISCFSTFFLIMLPFEQDEKRRYQENKREGTLLPPVCSMMLYYSLDEINGIIEV